MVQGSGFRVQGSVFRVQSSVFRVQGTRFRVQGSGSVFSVELAFGLLENRLCAKDAEAVTGRDLQGYLTHEKALTPLGPP